MAANNLTFLQIVNKVLIRLREEEVAAFDENHYSELIASLVNTVKGEMEAKWTWHAMRTTISVSAVSPTTQYRLTGAGMNAEIISAWNTTTSQRMARGTYAEFDAYFFGTPTVHISAPEKYILRGFHSSGDRNVDIWPQPSGNFTLKFQVYVPQADLDNGATIPLVPQQVLLEEVIARALLEKGEDGARQPKPDETFILADMLAEAVARDQSVDADEMDWETE